MTLDIIKCELCFELFEWRYNNAPKEHRYFRHLTLVHNVGYPEILKLMEKYEYE